VFRKGFARCPLDGAPLYEIANDPLEGSIFADRYVIEQCVGEGGMGRVYRATHRHMSRQFAIKVLFGEHAAEKEMQARFAREAEAACRLRHPNVVSVIDFGATPRGLFYLVMDWVEGQRLTDIICNEAPLPQYRIADIARQICMGLSHAHEQGLVHRDLKSENIIISHENGRELVRLVDFGLAVVMESDANARLTAEGTVYGTPAYMSPEQACGAKLDGRTDLFSLGVLIYEMLSGVLPFSGAPMDIVRQNMESEPPPISERVPGLHPSFHLESLARRLMAKRQQDRYQSAGEVMAVLDAMQSEWTLPRLSRSNPRMATVQVRRSPRWLRIATVALLLSVLGIAAALFVPDAEGWLARVTGGMLGTPSDSGEVQVVRVSDPAGTAPAPGEAGQGQADVAPAVEDSEAQAAQAAQAADDGAPEVPEEIEENGPAAAQAEAPDAGVDQGAVANEASDTREAIKQGRRRPSRHRRGETRVERQPQRTVVPTPPVQGGTETQAPPVEAEIAVADLNRAYKEVGDLLERLTQERGGPAADALGKEYFAIPIGTAQLNVKLRKDAWDKLQNLRRRAREALSQ
jgi:hypothetical protein